MSGAALGVDVGGTFTDLAALVDGRVVTAKVPSTPQDQSGGVMAVLDAVDLGEIATFAHGMTVATNALLERRGARAALVTTEGFRDVLEIGRQARPDLYDLARRRPAPLVPRDLRFTVRERMGPEGELEPLDEDVARGRGARGCRRPTSRRSRCACCSPSCIPSTRCASATRSARRCPACTCRSPARCCRRCASTSG